MDGRRWIGVAALGLLLGIAPPLWGGWEVSPTNDAAVMLTVRNTPVMSSHYVFWAQPWKWAGPKFELGSSRGGVTALAGVVPLLGATVTGTIQSPSPNQLKYTWTIVCDRQLQGIVGGGLEFDFDLENPSLGAQKTAPVLLDGNRGWRWASADGEVRLEFDRALASIYFEKGRQNVLRAMLIGSQVTKGTHTISMTLTLPPGGFVARSLGERYGELDTKAWYSDALAHDRSPVDLGFLNHRPAGKLGFVRAEGERLVYGDGSEARFWGGNLAAYAIAVESEQIETQARRIASLGFNLMRIHHHDSSGWVSRSVIDRTAVDSRHLNAATLDRLDYWIKCLRDEGVYVWLDLHVGRVFKSGDNIGEGFAEMEARSRRKSGGAEAKGYCYFNGRIEELMQEFNERYLTHVNRYTGLAYKDDPAVMGLLITNENDLTCHFGNLMLPDKHNPYHHRLFAAAAGRFAAAQGLPAASLLRTWEPGPAKLFLADCEYAWNRRMLDHLGRLGVNAPVATTSMWGGMPLAGLPPLLAGGIIDAHSYGAAEALSTNPRFESNYIAYMASVQAYGKPMSVSEWNVPYPAADRFTAPLYVASIAALQGWDAPMIYNYSQESFGRPTMPGTWSTFSDPALSGMMPAAALAFRQGHIAPARKRYCLVLDRTSLTSADLSSRTSAALRTLAEQSQVTIGVKAIDELPWLTPTELAAGVEQIADRERDYIPPGQNFVASDTGELRHDWVKGIQTIDSPQTQAAQGWVGGQVIALGGTEFRISTAKAAVVVSSLDGRPIGQSRRMLITAIARVVSSPDGKMPLLSEPVRGEIRVTGPEGLRLLALGTSGDDLEPLAADWSSGRYLVKLPRARGTHWYLLAEGE